MPTPEELKAAEDAAKVAAEAKAKADAEAAAKVKADADAKAEAERIKGMTAEQLRDYNDRLKAEAIENRHKAKGEKDRADSLAAELASLKAADDKRKADEMAAQGRFKELADASAVENARLKAERDGLKVKADKFEAALSAEEAALSAEVGDAAKDLDLSALPLETRVSTLRSIAKIKRDAAGTVRPPVSGTPPGRTGPTAEAAKVQEQRDAILNDSTLSYAAKAVRLRNLKQG
jgi:hypothetical protein